MDDIQTSADKLYENLEKNGIEELRRLFAKGKTLQQELKFDLNKEYLKKIIIAQIDIEDLLYSHKYIDTGMTSDDINESKQILQKVNNERDLKFDDEIMEALFGNTLEISNQDEYEQWKDIIYYDRHGNKELDDIFFEEEFKYNYENEKNPLKRAIKSFKYKKILKNDGLEDIYIKKIRKMINDGIKENPENSFVAYNNCIRLLERGIKEYDDIKVIEDIARMALASFKVKPNEILDIETECKKLRQEIKDDKSLEKMDTEYRKSQVTLGSEEGIRSRRIIETIPFEEVPDAMKNLQSQYENEYKKEQTDEDYIKAITKIYVDFMYIQPYADGNKRTAACLFNSMLLSKGVVPPPISLVNDEEMIKAFYEVKDKEDYTSIQNLAVEKYRQMKKNTEDSRKTKIQYIAMDNNLEK